MIQFNLLPDVKLDYIKAQRTRQLVLGVSIIVSASAVGLLILMLSASAIQKKHLSDLSNDIKQESKTLSSKPDINTILTVQNQLESLTGLHNSKPAATRLFSYLNSVTPSTVSISNLNTDFTQYTMIISGNADALSSVNQYIDTLKLTTYSVAGSSDAKPAFSNVVLSSFGLNNNAKDKTQAATYTINLSYNKDIFDNTQQVTLTVPNITTHGTDLFKTGSNN